MYVWYTWAQNIWKYHDELVSRWSVCSEAYKVYPIWSIIWLSMHLSTICGNGLLFHSERKRYPVCPFVKLSSTGLYILHRHVSCFAEWARSVTDDEGLADESRCFRRSRWEDAAHQATDERVHDMGPRGTTQNPEGKRVDSIHDTIVQCMRSLYNSDISIVWNSQDTDLVGVTNSSLRLVRNE